MNITRDSAWQILCRHVASESLRGHCLAVINQVTGLEEAVGIKKRGTCAVSHHVLRIA